jgi:hypothetical protein
VAQGEGMVTLNNFAWKAVEVALSTFRKKTRRLSQSDRDCNKAVNCAKKWDSL